MSDEVRPRRCHRAATCLVRENSATAVCERGEGDSILARFLGPNAWKGFDFRGIYLFQAGLLRNTIW